MDDFPSAATLDADLVLPLRGPPLLRNWEALSAKPYLFLAVAPADAGIEAARLFAAVHAEGANIRRLGAPAASAERHVVVLPVRIDPALVRRFWERGEHVGDIRLAGQRDAIGRPDWRALTYLDLTDGFAARNALTMPPELCRSLASLMASSPAAHWRRSAELLDPNRILRQSASLPETTFTIEGAVKVVAEEEAEAERIARARRPRPDYRFFPDRILQRELDVAGGVLMTGRPDLDPNDGMFGTVAAERLPGFAAAVAAKNLDAAEQAWGQILWMVGRAKRLAATTTSECANASLAEGLGAGGAFCEEIFREGGIAETALARLRDPGTHRAERTALAPLGPAPDERIVEQVLTPATLLRVAPSRLSVLEDALRRPGIERWLPVLALTDEPMAHGAALRDVLGRAAFKRHAEMKALEARTRAAEAVLRRMIELGTRDPAAWDALRALEVGRSVLDRALERPARARAACRD